MDTDTIPSILLCVLAITSISDIWGFKFYFFSIFLGPSWRSGCYWTCWTFWTKSECWCWQKSTKPPPWFQSQNECLHLLDYRDRPDLSAPQERTEQMVCLDPSDLLDRVVEVEKPVLLWVSEPSIWVGFKKKKKKKHRNKVGMMLNPSADMWLISVRGWWIYQHNYSV